MTPTEQRLAETRGRVKFLVQSLHTELFCINEAEDVASFDVALQGSLSTKDEMSRELHRVLGAIAHKSYDVGESYKYPPEEEDE